MFFTFQSEKEGVTVTSTG